MPFVGGQNIKYKQLHHIDFVSHCNIYKTSVVLTIGAFYRIYKISFYIAYHVNRSKLLEEKEAKNDLF